MTGDITLDFTGLVAVLQATTVDMKSHTDKLREIDAVVGDGDLGVTVRLGADALNTYLAAPGETDIGKVLAECGMTINRVNPSTFGTLLASAFLGASKAAQNKPRLIATDLLAMGEGAINNVKKRGKAEVGDKTMLDALVPAVAAFKKSLEDHESDSEAMSAAVAAAEAGVQATEQMRAKVGRGSYRQDGTVGVRDGGATAIYFLIESFARHLIEWLKLT